VHKSRDARTDCAAQYEQRSVIHVRQQAVDASVQLVHGGIQMLIHRSADDGNHDVGITQALAIRGRAEVLAHNLPQQQRRAPLHERHLTVVDHVNFPRVHIEQSDRKSALRKDQPKR